MSVPIFVPVISTNAMHADHKPGNLEAWFNQGGFIRALTAVAGIPCSISIEGFDVELLPELANFMVQHKGPGEIISGEWSHLMPWFAEMADRRLVVSNFTNPAVYRDHPVTFVSEYSTLPPMVAKALVDSRQSRPAIYVVDTAVTPYSTFAEEDGPIKPLGQFAEYEGAQALVADGILHMRMYMDLAGIINGKFFAFQRLRNSQDAAKKTTAEDVVVAMKKAVEEADKRNVPVLFWPMDLESCVIGSNYGPTVYEELCEAMSKSDLPLAGPRQAYAILNAQAVETDRLYREVNNKWAGYPNQEALRTSQAIMVHELSSAQLNKDERKLELLGIGSDAYVWRKHQNKGVNRLTMETDTGDLTWLGENEACHQITTAVSKHFRKKDQVPFTKSLRQYLSKQDDTLLQLTLAWAQKLDL